MNVGEKVSLVITATVIELFDLDGVQMAELELATNAVPPLRVAVRTDRTVTDSSVIGQLARGKVPA